MYCPRCRFQGKIVKMKSSKRSFHKKIKWLCPDCGLVRMEKQ